MTQWTQKEASLLQDLKGQEQLCVEKYSEYAQRAHDPALKGLLTAIGETEVGHLNTLTDMLAGRMPQPAQQGQQGQQGQQNQQNQQQGQQNQQPGFQPPQQASLTPDMQQDAYLCRDLLADEKYVSASYNTSIFEFRSPQARQILNGIQSAEQSHGEQLYAYMAQRGMYNA